MQVLLFILIKSNDCILSIHLSPKKKTYILAVYFTTLYILRPRNKKNTSSVLNPVKHWST